MINYTEITNSIVADMEAGIMPWEKPWQDDGISCGLLPINCATAHAYSGMNILILWQRARQNGWPNSWAGLKQMQAIGGRLRRAEGFNPPADKPYATGQHATKIIRLVTYKKPDESETMYARAVVIPVFNLAQFDCYDPALLKDRVQVTFSDEAVESFVRWQSVSVLHGGDAAYYDVARDIVRMPSSFNSDGERYSTLFHELVHSTRHPSRLDRQKDDYAYEELVAEIGSAFLCARFGAVPQTRHSDYIGHWIKRLKDNSKTIFHAAHDAQAAVEFLLAQEPMRQAA